jgi:hypothetical protein
LHLGDFSQFETTLLVFFQDFYNEVVEYFMQEVSRSVAFCRELKKLAAK